MRHDSTTATITTEFGHELEAERQTWLNQRFLWYAGVIGSFYGLWAVWTVLRLLTGIAFPIEAPWASVAWLQVVVTLLSASLYWGAFAHVRTRGGNRSEVLRLVMLLIVANGFLQLLTSLVAMRMGLSEASIGQAWTYSIFVSHLFACVFLPFTPWEAFRPVLPLLAVNAIFVLTSKDPWLAKGLTIVLSPLVGVPGVLICWWRQSRFRDRFALRFLRGRYGELRAELTNARMIHEALFPKPCNHGPLQFRYVYQPMRQIGGDYLYACFTPGSGAEAALNVVVIDVTGHGIPAALTVNRLHGELERIFAENPGASPGDVLVLLNRYVHLTLASHSVYVTAICFRADPVLGTIEYASGGHPPAFLRAVDGTVEQLDSTTFVLGACAAADFRAEPRTLRFMPGDVLIAYTDGATEARDSRGRFLGITGMQKLVAQGHAGVDGAWAASILGQVDTYRQGPPADDTLVIEIARPMQYTERPRPATRIAVVSP